jgi:hypothetical protein
MIVTEFTIDVHTGLGLWYDFKKSYLRYYLKNKNSVIGFYASSHQNGIVCT